MSQEYDLEKLITNHNRRLQKLKERKALEGLSADPKIRLEIENIEAEIKQLQMELEQLGDTIEPADPKTRSMSESSQKGTISSQSDMQVDFVIVTALEEERNTVLDKLPDYQKLMPSEDDIHLYYSSRLPVNFPDGSTDIYHIVVMSLLNMGRVQATAATNDAIRRWSPRYVILVGIAGGIAESKVRLGDVLISSQIVDYDLQKLTPDTEPQMRWEVHRASPRLIAAVRNFDDSSWQELITVKRPTRGNPKCYIGPIASGDKIIADGEVLRRLRSKWPKLLGVEMEAAGVATAAFQAAQQPGFFMVRGVSDLADRKKNSARVQRWRAYACDVAASYTIALLKSGPVLPSLGAASIVDQESRPKSISTPRTPTLNEIILSNYVICLWEDEICVKKINLRKNATYLIGRSQRCHFQIDDKYKAVSRRHARIKRLEQTVVVLDGDGVSSSRYGTFVNGVSVDDEQGVALKEGDRIVLGGFIDFGQLLMKDEACLLTFELQALNKNKICSINL